MEVELFTASEPDPSVETVMMGAAAMARFQRIDYRHGRQLPIDAAKAMWINMNTRSVRLRTCARSSACRSCAAKSAFLAAVPSTSGTATEVTGVLHHHRLFEGHQIPHCRF